MNIFVISVTFEPFNPSLLNKLIHFLFKTTKTVPKLFNSIVPFVNMNIPQESTNTLNKTKSKKTILLNSKLAMFNQQV